ncbi:glycosyltransferase family 4 protein [Saccharospirillum impatiens]|uniref:glycosyltransferase family 4 protein n=1 Tax=Saccharospirillum impatiens TaxID=169438 RepID=UPI000402BFE4|nr:glycosyltransferase family 4 protein [Saccharospirillum impatiens]
MPKRTGVNLSDGTPELVLSDLHHRITGVSASIRAVLPKLGEHYPLMFLARRAEGSVTACSLWSGFREMARAPVGRPFRIWHVRRNNEMFWGILARDVCRLPVKLVFTSAAIRSHSWYPRQLIARMDAVIATSDRAAEYLSDVAAVVPHGVDIERFEKHESNGMASDIEAWARYPVRLGMIGRVRPEKGTDLFVDALCSTLPNHPLACAVVAGKVTSKYKGFADQLRRRLAAAGILDRVFFLDEVGSEQMPELYGQLDIVCAPARYEGFGLVPIEAMVSGTAIIASRTGAYEAMVDEGGTGFLVDLDSSSQVADAIERLLSDPDLLDRLKQAGRAKVRHQFSLDIEVAGISRVYESLWHKASHKA